MEYWIISSGMMDKGICSSQPYMTRLIFSYTYNHICTYTHTSIYTYTYIDVTIMDMELWRVLLNIYCARKTQKFILQPKIKSMFKFIHTHMYVYVYILYVYTYIYNIKYKWRAFLTNRWIDRVVLYLSFYILSIFIYIIFFPIFYF